MNDTSRRVIVVLALTVAPLLLALGVAVTGRADAAGPDPCSQLDVSQAHGVSGTIVAPDTPKHFEH
jgi:hypothetical protein